MTVKAISADSHMDLTFLAPDTFISRVPAQFRDRAPRVVLQLPLLPPSADFKRQIYATFQKDFHGVKAMAEIAPDNVMWGSAYPHRDGTWPFSQKAIEEQFRGIDESVKRKMLRDNVRRVYANAAAVREGQAGCCPAGAC